MKIKRILIAVLLFSAIASGLKYLDLCISDKYEVQLEGLNPTQMQIREANKLKKKIEIEKKVVFSILVGSLIAIYPLSMLKK